MGSKENNEFANIASKEKQSKNFFFHIEMKYEKKFRNRGLEKTIGIGKMGFGNMLVVLLHITIVDIQNNNFMKDQNGGEKTIKKK